MNNKKLLELLRRENIRHWQIAEVIGMHESAFSRWFRKELSQEQRVQVLSAVEEIKLKRLEEQKQAMEHMSRRE